jgi:hypothetical protein
MGFANLAFDYSTAQYLFEEELDKLGINYDKIGWDYYDSSLEIYGAVDDCRLSTAAQEFIFNEGFMKIFVNHLNGWQTHYCFDHNLPFSPVNGWRRKRCPDGHFQINYLPEAWGERGKEWVRSGYMEIVNEN